MTTLFPVSSTPAMRQTAPIAIEPTPSCRQAQRREHRACRRAVRGGRRTRTRRASAGRGTPRRASRSGCGSLGARRRRRRRPGDEAERGDADGAERPAGAGDRGDASEHRPEERAGDRGGERLPISAPRRPAGRAATSHASAPVHENELASPCRKRARSSCHASVAKPKSTVHRDAAQADEHRRLDAEACRDDAARDRSEERAGRVGRREHAGAGLAEPELVRVVRQQRRQRREEERVDEDDRARQDRGACARPTLDGRTGASNRLLLAQETLRSRHRVVTARPRCSRGAPVGRTADRRRSARDRARGPPAARRPR